MIVAVLTVDLYIPGATSLKEKRAVLRKLKDRVGKKFNVSIAEVEFMDKWQRARIGVAQVGNDYKFLEKSINTIFKVIDNVDDAQVTDHSLEYL